MKKKYHKLYFIIIILAVVTLFWGDIIFGSVTLSLSQVWSALFSADSDEAIQTIIWRFRVPKAIVAILAGAALSASGLQMQTLFRNPLAGPYVLGISSGASLGVSMLILGLPLLSISFESDILRNIGVVGAAWVGSAAILAAIIAVSTRIKDIMAILILGMMFGSASGAIVEILQYLSPEGALKSFVVWSMGSLGGVTTTQLAILVPVLLAGLVISILLIKPLNTLLLGENYARSMGVNINVVRRLIFVSTTLLAGTITAFCGPIGFIGIAVPHMARMFFMEADHKTLMPASMLLGAAVMLLCDLIAQLPGSEMTVPINSITALIGIPIVILVIIKNKKIF